MGRQEDLLAHRPFGARAFVPREELDGFCLGRNKTQLPQEADCP